MHAYDRNLELIELPLVMGKSVHSKTTESKCVNLKKGGST